mgnify:FL=1
MPNYERVLWADDKVHKMYDARDKALDALDEQINKTTKTTKRNNLERKRRLILQSDPILPQHYGRTGKQFETDRVQKKVRHDPGVSNVLRVPEGSVWHHVIESQTGQNLFQGNLSRNDTIELNKYIGKTNMVLGNPRDAVEELPERLHKGGKSTTNQIEDIHTWVTKNTPKDASWTKLTPESSLADRKIAATDLANFYDKSKKQIQKLQFSANQLGDHGKATKASIEGKELIPGWHGNFSDQILNPRRSSLTIKPKPKIAGGLRKTDTALRLAQSAATGNLVGGSLAAGQLAMQEALSNPKVQKNVAKQIAKLVEARGKKTIGKLIPGLDVLISGKETWDYLSQGKLDQAGIAAVSGAIGWIPVVGDGASAALDLTNTGIDIARLNITSQPDVRKRSEEATIRDYLEDESFKKRTFRAPKRLKIGGVSSVLKTL